MLECYREDVMQITYASFYPSLKRDFVNISSIVANKVLLKIDDNYRSRRCCI